MKITKRTRKKVIKEKSLQQLNRFNGSLKANAKFQKVMEEILYLLYDNKFSVTETNKIFVRNAWAPPSHLKQKIENGFLLSCRIELDMLLKIQRTLKEITGEYVLMDDFILSLLHWFYFFYNNKKTEVPPFVALEKKKKNQNKNI